METAIARRLWTALEPVHACVYFAPEPKEAYEALGLERISQYFASRSAPMGAVSHGVVAATFFNFSPGLVRRAMRDAWSTATPAEVLDARHTGVLATLNRCIAGTALREALPEVIDLAVRATSDLDPSGRALFAGHQSLPLPEEPALAMWHLITLVREHRGDGHVTALGAEGFGPMDALLTAEGWSKLSRPQLEKRRGWRPEDWQEGASSLVARGWLLSDGSLSATGREARHRMEALTDELAMAPIRALGAEGTDRLISLLLPFGDAIHKGGGLPPE